MSSRSTDRDGWTRVRFGDVVSLVRDRVPDVASCDLNKYVRGEDFDPGEPFLRRHSMLGDGMHGPAFHMRFREGDVLYVSRNPRLRKAVQVDFDGICANTTYVCRADGVVLLQDLLVFVMQSESFTAYAKRHQRGSTNFYVNWSDLEPFELDLPPVVEQQRLAGVLSLANRCVLSAEIATRNLATTRRSLEATLLNAPLRLVDGCSDLRSAKPSIGWELMTGQDLLDRGYLVALQDGNHGSQYPRAEELGDEGLPYISATDISDSGEIDLAGCRRIRPERASLLRIPNARSGDVILTNNATVGRVTQLPPWPTEIVASTSTTYYRCNESALLPQYLRWFLESELYQWQLRSIMRQSTRNQVPITTQKRLLFAIPDRTRQEQIASLSDRLLASQRLLTARTVASSTLRSDLMEKALVH